MACLTFPVSAISESIIPIQELSFGTIVILDNSTSNYIYIDQNGQSGYQGIAPITQPSRAEYLLQGFPANKNLNVLLTLTKPNTESDQYSSEQFVVTQLYYDNTVQTSSDGSATIFIGGRLETSGSGVNAYSDSNYDARFTITVN